MENCEKKWERNPVVQLVTLLVVMLVCFFCACLSPESSDSGDGVNFAPSFSVATDEGN